MIVGVRPASPFHLFKRKEMSGIRVYQPAGTALEKKEEEEVEEERKKETLKVGAQFFFIFRPET